MRRRACKKYFWDFVADEAGREPDIILQSRIAEPIRRGRRWVHGKPLPENIRV